jgi:RNA polymerase-associated protein RTF1
MIPIPLLPRKMRLWSCFSLSQMSEIEREDILSQRLEEMQRIQDKRNLDQMLKAQNGRGAEPDSVSKAAKREHSRTLEAESGLIEATHRPARY